MFPVNNWQIPKRMDLKSNALRINTVFGTTKEITYFSFKLYLL